MKLNVYSFFDSAAQAFTQPFYMHNNGLALRAFADNVNAKEENNMSIHPEHFTLFKLGEWDDKSAKMEMLEAPQQIAIGVELINDTKPRYANVDLQELADQVAELISYHKGRKEINNMKVITEPDAPAFLKKQGE